MSWLASIEVREDGIWYIRSAVCDTWDDAWVWLNSQKISCRAVRLQFRRAKVKKHKPVEPDPNQFAFLQGNEECAREWQQYS